MRAGSAPSGRAHERCPIRAPAVHSRTRIVNGPVYGRPGRAGDCVHVTSSLPLASNAMSGEATLVCGVATLRVRSQRPFGRRIATFAAPHVTAIVPLSETAARVTTPPAEPGTTAGVVQAANAEVGASATASTESTSAIRVIDASTPPSPPLRFIRKTA